MNIDMTQFVSKTFILSGILLVMVNFVGLFHYTVIDESNPHILDNIPRKISEQEFWDNAYRQEDENIEMYCKRLTTLISGRMLSINSHYTKPTFFENYILWACAQYKNCHEWSDTKKAVRLGGGLCSQHAIIFNNILREQEIQSRILALSGHVVNEVLIEGTWHIFDPVYNVAFEMSLEELESNPRMAYQEYINAGRPPDEANHCAEFFGSDADNWHFSSSNTYAIRRTVIEMSSFYLIWILPIVLIFSGIAMRMFRLTRRYV